MAEPGAAAGRVRGRAASPAGGSSQADASRLRQQTATATMRKCAGGLSPAAAARPPATEPVSPPTL